MCGCIAQLRSPDSYLQCLANEAWLPEPDAYQPAERVGVKVHRPCPDLRDNDHIIRPNHRLVAMMYRDGELHSEYVRWGWSPVWSMGVRPPLTHKKPLQAIE
jgi:putative SOS response-associated peptidase YedK